MKRGTALSLIAFLLLFNSCTLKNTPNEPRTLTSVHAPAIVEDNTELNATYSYLVYLFHANRGETEIARTALAQTLAYDAESSELKLQQAQDLFSRGLYASARDQIKGIRESNTEAERLYIQVLIREGNLSEARVALDSWLKSNPKDEESYSLRAKIEIEDQNLGPAKKIIESFLAQIPDSSQAFLLRGRLNQIENKDKLALADYKRALELDPQNISAAAHLAFLQDLSGQKQDATQTYAWLADLTDNPEFHKRLGALYIERADTRRAIAALEAYARHQPEDNQNIAKLAALYMDLKDFEQAEYKLKFLLIKEPNNDSLRYYYAAALYELGKKQLALGEVRKIKRDSELFSERLRIELLSLWDLGQQAAAKNLAQSTSSELLARSVTNDELLYPVLYTFFSTRKMKVFAQQILQRGLDLFPKNTILRYNQALACDESGDWKEALKVGQSLLKDDSKNPAVKNLVGYILTNQGIDLAKAEKLIEEALKTKPDDPFMLDSKAWLKFKQNKLPEALALIEQAHQSKPEEPVILVHLGDILAKMGRIQDAKGWYEKAIQLGVEPVHERIRIQETVANFQKNVERKISCSPGNLCK